MTWLDLMLALVHSPAHSLGTDRPQLEADKDPFRIREIADDLAHRRRQFAHQRWDGDDLVLPRPLGILNEIDDLDRIFSWQVLIAEFLEVFDSADRFLGLTRHIKA